MCGFQSGWGNGKFIFYERVTNMILKKFFKTAQISFQGQTNGGFLYLLPLSFVNVIYLLPLMFLWKVVAQSGVDVGMSLAQLLTYTFVNAILSDMMNVTTFATAWNYEGKLGGLFVRPMSVFWQVISQTVGGWLPKLLVFSLPMLLAAPLFGISVVPATLWFFPSLLLCISLGFAIEFFFVCVTIRLRGMAYLGYVIRMAIVSLFSGTVVPFKLLPFGLDKVFELQPFGSLGGAPLSLFVGTVSPYRTILLQIFWNVIIWIVAVYWFKKSQERMVSFGG